MNTFLCQSVRSLLVVAAAGVVGVASAASISEFTSIDIMESVRQSEVESPFTFSTTGENDGSHSEQLFDGDLTADNTKSSDQNGRAIFTISKGPSITVSFNPAVFGNRQLFLQQYGFRMWYKNPGSAWNIDIFRCCQLLLLSRFHARGACPDPSCPLHVYTGERGQ